MKNINIQKILVPTDFSETGLLAIDHAGFLAKLLRADLLLLHVIPAADHSYDILGLRPPDMHYQERLNTAVDQKLAELSSEMEHRHGIRVKAMHASGNVAREVNNIVESEQIDLVVMGTHGAKGFGEIFLGSNAHKIVNTVPCPVLTVQESARRLGFKDIVLPIDRSMHSREKVPIALALADKSAARVHIVGLLGDEEPTERNKLNIVLDQVQEAVERHNLPFSRHIVVGSNIAVAALEYAAGANADLIVTMTDHESNLTGPFMGPFAKQIVNHSRIPVLSIKPSERGYVPLDMGGASTAV